MFFERVKMQHAPAVVAQKYIYIKSMYPFF